MSQFVAYCPGCDKRYSLDDRHVGKTLQCPACRTTFAIDGPEEEIVQLEDTFPSVVHEPSAPGSSHTADSSPASWTGQNPAAGHAHPLDHSAQIPQGSKPYGAPVQAAGSAPQTWIAKAPLGGLERGLILLGICMFLMGLTLLLLPLVGLQLPAFAGRAQLGQNVGLLMALGGAAFGGIGLRRFRGAAIAMAGGTAAAALIVFGVSGLWNGNTAGPVVHSGNRNAGESTTRSVAVANTSHAWARAWPQWEGFSVAYPSSPALDWERVMSSIQGISVSLPGDTTLSELKLRVGGRNASVTYIESEFGTTKYRIGTFRYPFSDRTDREKLDAVQKTLPGEVTASDLQIGRFSARELKGTNETISQHAVVAAVGDLMVLLTCEGLPESVPGEGSQKAIASLVLSPAIAADRSQDAGDALDPFAMDSKSGLGVGTNAAAPTRSPAAPPALSAANRNRIDELGELAAALHSTMAAEMDPGSGKSFPPRYLSVPAGDCGLENWFFASPGKLPVIGVDFVVEAAASGHVFSNVIPVYNDAATCAVKAKPGYALSGIHVNAPVRVEGIKFIFSRVADDGFAAGDSYETEWFGTPSAGPGQVLSSDNRPLYGLWTSTLSTGVCSSIGLIRESQ